MNPTETPPAPPTSLVIPIIMITDEKRRIIMQLNKLKPTAERSHLHGELVGKISMLEWLESEIANNKRVKK
jgi:hypothetical protein